MAIITKRINKKGEITFRFRFSGGYDSCGKQIIKSMTWKPNTKMTEKQAEKEAAKQAILFENQLKSNDLAFSKVKFKDLADEWLEIISKTNELKTSTYERIKKCRERTYKSIGDIAIDELKFKKIQQFIIELSKSGVNQRTGLVLSQKTQKHYLTFISDVMRYAIKCGLISENPCKNVTTVKTDKKEKQVYSLEELKAIIEKLNEKAPIDYKVFFLLAAYCGLRRGEILGLEYKDIDFENSTLSIVRTSNYVSTTGTYTSTPKTKNSIRTLVLPNDLLKNISKLKQVQNAQKMNCGDLWHETDRLFIQWNGLPMHPNTPYTWFERFCQKENIKFKGLHSFRHAFATQAITNGVDVSTVSSILGHSQVSTTLNIYTHEVQAAKAKAMNIVADLIQSQDK